jgi:hypothetical protein
MLIVPVDKQIRASDIFGGQTDIQTDQVKQSRNGAGEERAKKRCMRSVPLSMRCSCRSEVLWWTR